MRKAAATGASRFPRACRPPGTPALLALRGSGNDRSARSPSFPACSGWAAGHGPPSAGCRPAGSPVGPRVVYGFGRMDESDRVADRAMISMVGWQPGDRLTLIAHRVTQTATCLARPASGHRPASGSQHHGPQLIQEPTVTDSPVRLRRRQRHAPGEHHGQARARRSDTSRLRLTCCSAASRTRRR